MNKSAAQYSDTLALNRACQTLWLATLSLMTAFMHLQGPAQRYLIARRIGKNFATLCVQACFSVECRKTFHRLSDHWHAKADRLAPNRDHDSDRHQGGLVNFAR